MEHHQFEMQVAAILAAGIAQTKGVTDPSEAVSLLAEVHKEIVSRGVIEHKRANFIAKTSR